MTMPGSTPGSTPDPAGSTGGLDGQAYAGQDLEALADIPNYQRWILRHFSPHLQGRVLEIGAGIGTLSQKYVHAVDEAVLLEPALNLVPTLRQRFGEMAHVSIVPDFLHVACANGTASLQSDSFHAVLLVNVLEHVEDDRAMLRQVRQLLRPGGTLLLFVPALQWLYGSLDEMVGHFRRYVRAQLRTLVLEAEFELESIRYFDALGRLPWFFAGRVLKRRRFDALAARIYDRIGVPLGSLAERVIAPPSGKNLICVARRSH